MSDKRINDRLQLRNALNDLLLEIEKLIDLADSLRKERKRKDADLLMRRVDDLMATYTALDTHASEIDSEATK